MHFAKVAPCLFCYQGLVSSQSDRSLTAHETSACVGRTATETTRWTVKTSRCYTTKARGAKELLTRVTSSSERR
jgi:hypothetical protein